MSVLGKMPSNMEHKFSEVPHVGVQRSAFQRNHGYKTTMDAGDLNVIFWDSVYPGDTHTLDASIFARMSTPIVPLMDNLYMDVHYFFVPNRLIWDNWEKFMGARTEDPSDSIDYNIPTLDISTAAVGSLPDQFGLPVGTTNAGCDVNALYFRAYNLIYREWYRDGNLIDSPTVQTDDGPDTLANYTIRKRGKRHDYFTSALPWPQRSTSPVTLPLGTEAPIFGKNMDFAGAPPSANNYAQVLDAPGGTLKALDTGAYYLHGVNSTNGTGQLMADLSNATAATINSIREAFQIQKLLEKDARGGSARYVELIKSHFNVTSPDYRMQRPEFLGGGTINININQIAQTSSTDATTPQGNVSGYATAQNFNRIGFNQSFTEHGVILGICSIRSDLNYQQGIEKDFLRSTRYDYYWPSFAHLGEEPIENQELYYTDEASGTASTTNTGVFGYQEVYADLRYKKSIISGKMRSGVTGTVDIWHAAQEFGALPTLNQTFIEEAPPMSRILAVSTEPEFYFDSYNRYRSVRPMPVFSVPGFVDHF
jgi:hypothetical protein